jgi:hypothetical protein
MRSGFQLFHKNVPEMKRLVLESDEGDDLKGLWRIMLAKEKQLNSGFAARIQREIYVVWLNSCA